MITFLEPRFLWLGLLIPPVLWLGWLGRQRLGKSRAIGSLILRALLLLCLIGSLAGAQLMRSVDTLTTVFLIDVSDSITPAQQASFEQFISESLQGMPADDRAAIIVFGDNALIERVPSDIRTLARLQSVPLANRTNIESALTLGFALFPSDTQKRLVLLSDGGENTGRALNAMRLAQQRQVSLDVIDLPPLQGAEVSIVSLEAPTQIRDGQEVAIGMQMYATSEQQATLRISIDETLFSEQSITLPVGTTDLTTTLKLEGRGYHSVTAELIPTDDTRKQNNEATTLINIGGAAKVLIVANTPEDSTNIERALQAAGLLTEVFEPRNMPDTLGELGDYDVIVIANVSASQLPPSTQSIIQTFVRDLGRGVVVIGGEESYGIGGYTDTPLAEILPVEMELRNLEKYPPLSVVVSFDISGSMSESIGGRMKVELAAEGAARVVQLLRDEDELTVIPFDSAVQNQYGPVPGSQRNEAMREIIARGVPGGGGIEVRGALDASGAVLEDRPFPLRHIILLADGADSQDQQGAVELVTRYRRNGITTSVVAVGNGGDVPFLRNVANAGGGRFFLVENAAVLPDIVLQEAQLALAPYLVETDFVPLMGNDSPILADLTNRTWPVIKGLNGTMPKEQATMVLWGPDDLPLLAQWQYGLGRTVAWTSDFKGQWGTNLINWEHFPRLIAQMVQWTLPAISADQISVSTSFIGTEIETTVTALNEQNQPFSGLNTEITIVGPDGPVATLNADEIGGGIYRGRTVSPPTGTYFLQISGTTADGKPAFQRTIGVIVPYSPEYRQGQANPFLLQALIQHVNGRTINQPSQAFEHTLEAVKRAVPIGFLLLLAALLLLPMDIAIRRLRLRSLRELMPSRTKAKPDASFGKLHEAKQRARSTLAAADPKPIEQKPSHSTPVYRAAPPPPSPPSPPPVEPVEQPPKKPTESPWAPPTQPLPGYHHPTQDVDLEQITDPLERLKAAKNRARRR